MGSDRKSRNPSIRGSVEERFRAKYTVQPDGCWLWLDGGLNNGYGQLFTGKTTVLAHRWAYEHFKGSIPAELVVDHQCHNRDATCAGGMTCKHRRCVNPSHLDLTDSQTNIRRSHSSSVNKTECKYGHAYDEANTIQRRDGTRRCRACQIACHKELAKTRLAQRRALRGAKG